MWSPRARIVSIDIFLAGTAAYLYWQKIASRAALSKFLLVRGLWLVLLELTLLRFGWTFNFDYASLTFAGVIWAIGWSMVVLALLVYLPTAVVTAIGLAIIAGHNALAPLLYSVESSSSLLRIFYVGEAFRSRTFFGSSARCRSSTTCFTFR